TALEALAEKRTCREPSFGRDRDDVDLPRIRTRDGSARADAPADPSLRLDLDTAIVQRNERVPDSRSEARVGKVVKRRLEALDLIEDRRRERVVILLGKERAPPAQRLSPRTSARARARASRRLDRRIAEEGQRAARG